MVYTSLHGDDLGVGDISLCYFSFKQDTCLYNQVPNRQFGLNPLELLTKTNTVHYELLCLHAWGCPVYVLDAKFQNDQKFQSRIDDHDLENSLVFLMINDNSSLVANVRHLKTGYISPQYHFFYNLFHAVFISGDNNFSIVSIWIGLFDNGCNWYAELEYEERKLVYNSPPLNEVCLDETVCCKRKDKLSQKRQNCKYMDPNKWVNVPGIIPTDPISNPPPDGILITGDGSNGSGDDYLPIPSS